MVGGGEGEVFSILAFIIYMAERLLAQFSKMIHTCFCVENNMAAIHVTFGTYKLVCTFSSNPPPQDCLAIYFVFESFCLVCRGIYMPLYHSETELL
jgi:hypothetical protein